MTPVSYKTLSLCQDIFSFLWLILDRRYISKTVNTFLLSFRRNPFQNQLQRFLSPLLISTRKRDVSDMTKRNHRNLGLLHSSQWQEQQKPNPPYPLYQGGTKQGNTGLLRSSRVTETLDSCRSHNPAKQGRNDRSHLAFIPSLSLLFTFNF